MNKEKEIYICDQTQCEPCSNLDCVLTTDPDHARQATETEQQLLDALNCFAEKLRNKMGGRALPKKCAKALEAVPPAQHWTPVREGLPVNHGQVWCTYDDGSMGLCHFDAQQKIFVSGFEVVAWMPLPERFQGDGNGE